MDNYINRYKLGFFSKGKHFKKNKGKKLGSNIFAQVSIVLLICLVTSSVAYLIKQNSIKNEFVIGEVKTQVVEDFDVSNKVKKNVSIENIGNVPIYIRSKIIISWKDKNQNIIEGIPQENDDYSIRFSESSNWLKGDDGYYYYKTSLEPNHCTDILVEECKQLKEFDDKILEVSIANQAIQTEPTKAVVEAWNIQVVDNLLVLKE